MLSLDRQIALVVSIWRTELTVEDHSISDDTRAVSETGSHVRIWLFEGPVLRRGKLRQGGKGDVFEIVLDLFCDEAMPRLIRLDQLAGFSHLVAHAIEECEWAICRKAQDAGWPIMMMGSWRPGAGTEPEAS